MIITHIEDFLKIFLMSSPPPPTTLHPPPPRPPDTLPPPSPLPHLPPTPRYPKCQLCPRYEGQLTRMAEPIPPSGQSSSYSLTTLSSSSSTDRRAETDRKVITTRIAVAHHFICRLRRRESCILGATSSQPTLPLHELPPARLVIHRQTSNHERRKGTLSVQSRSGILADFCPRQH